MKSAIYYIAVACLILCFTSCSTSTEFTVYGDPGTQILTPYRTTLATIDNSGEVEIKNPDDNYYAFLLSHKPGTNEYIPFALDYEKKSYAGSRFAKGLGMGLAYLGTTELVMGTIILLAGGEEAEDIYAPIMALGAVTGLAGIGFGMPAESRTQQLNHEYRYKYDSEQRTNQDIRFTKPKFDVAKPKSAEKQDNKVAATSKANKTLSSSNSTKSLKDNATKIEGTYIGEGDLKQGNEVIETYNNISVVTTVP